MGGSVKGKGKRRGSMDVQPRNDFDNYDFDQDLPEIQRRRAEWRRSIFRSPVDARVGPAQVEVKHLTPREFHIRAGKDMGWPVGCASGLALLPFIVGGGLLGLIVIVALFGAMPWLVIPGVIALLIWRWRLAGRGV